MTDGRDENNPGTAPGSVHTFAQVLERLKSVDATVYAVGLGRRSTATKLEELATISGGEAYFPQDVASLSQDFNRILETLRRRYVISYTSPRTARATAPGARSRSGAGRRRRRPQPRRLQRAGRSKRHGLMLTDDIAASRPSPMRSTVALLGDLVRALLWGLAFVVWISFAQVYLRMIRLTLSDPSHSDFTIFYYTARMVADGLPMYGDVAGAVRRDLGRGSPRQPQPAALPDAARCRSATCRTARRWRGVAVSVACLASSLVADLPRAAGGVHGRDSVVGRVDRLAAPFTTVAVTSEMTFVLMLPFTLAWRAWRRGSGQPRAPGWAPASA